jgi:hypothetical protein
MESTEQKQYFSTTKEMIEKYVENRLLIMKMEAADKGSTATTGIIVGVGLLFCGVCFLFFLSVFLAYALGNLIDNRLLGFGIISALYLAMILGCWFGRHAIVRKVSDIIVKMYFKNKDPKNAKKHTFTDLGEAAKN